MRPARLHRCAGARTAAAAIALAAASAACSGGAEPAADAAAAPVDAAEEAAVDAVPQDGSGVSGRLLDETGDPRAGTQVMACMAHVCLFGNTDSAGYFSFAVDAPAEIALKTPSFAQETPRRGAALQPVRLDEDQWIEVGSVYVPHLAEGELFQAADSDPQTLSVGDGLELTLHRGDLTPLVGEVLFDAAARQIPTSRRPSLDLDGEAVVAVYALHPFGAHSSSPIAVRMASDLSEGTEVLLRTISEIDGLFSEPISGVADGTAVVSEEGSGIFELTYLVISIPDDPS
jgi:hypothetical protein